MYTLEASTTKEALHKWTQKLSTSQINSGFTAQQKECKQYARHWRVIVND